MARSALWLWLSALWLWAARGAEAPTVRRAHGAHPRPPAHPALLDRREAADYRIDDAAYIGDYPGGALRDYDYQVTPERKGGDSEEEEYPDGEEEGKSTPTTSPTTAAAATTGGVIGSLHAATRTPWRYRNGTIYDDYVAPCAGLLGGVGRLRAQPICPLLAATLAAALRPR